ncbi:MAG: hypothetical protein J5I53_04725 [Bradyrhizobiaceae bacterium]|nr:hypothetical protein [Bradyrhizobiaceae bacterium]
MNNTRLCRVAFLTVLLTIGMATVSVAQQPPMPKTYHRSVLGDPTRIVLSCKNVIQSMAWWSRLGFTPTPGNTARPDSAITLADGQVVITLVKDNLPSPILMFASNDVRMLKDSLDSLRILTTYDVMGPTLGELRLRSPSGVHMAVRPSTMEPRIPTSGDSNIVCGKLTEISVDVADFPLSKEQRFWEVLDFSVERSGVKPYPFAVVTDGYVHIGLHEMRDIPSVAFTYFASNMVERIDRLKKSGITFVDEYKNAEGAVEHVYIESPDGQLVMLFTGNQ